MKAFGYVRLAVAPLNWSAATVFVAALFLPAIPAVARPTGEGEAQIARCIHRAAADRPWLEKTLWGLRDQEAGWIGAEVRNTNGSHDLGPLQINSGWVPRVASLLDRSEADVRNWLQYDPCFNADAARWIFLSALRATGSYWKAVGAYHSPTLWRQERYASSVAGHLRRRFGSGLFTDARPRGAVVQYTPAFGQTGAQVSFMRNADPASQVSPTAGLGFGVVRVLDGAQRTPSLGDQ